MKESLRIWGQENPRESRRIARGVAPLLIDLGICRLLSVDQVELWIDRMVAASCCWLLVVVVVAVVVEDSQLRAELSISKSDNYAVENWDNPTVSSVTVERWCLVAVSYSINLVTRRLLHTDTQTHS